MDKNEILEVEKVPSTSDNHVGIEIEFVSPYDEYELQDYLCDLDLHANCTLKDDGSINETLGEISINPFSHTEDIGGGCLACDWDDNNRQESGQGHELTVMCTEKDLVMIMNKVNQFLKKAKAEVNKSCGLHVHIDMRNRNFKEVVKNFMAKQKEMHTIVSKDRLTSTYCKPLSKADASRGTCDSRYRDINIQAYKKIKTIEIRLHEGCIDTKEITDWTKYLISIADKKKVSKLYVNRRIKKCS